MLRINLFHILRSVYQYNDDFKKSSLEKYNKDYSLDEDENYQLYLNRHYQYKEIKNNDDFMKQSLNNNVRISNIDKSINFSVRQDDFIFQYFKQLILNDRIIEEKKIQLSQMSDFNELDAFKIFDFKSTGFVNLQLFINQLKKLGVNYHQCDYLLLFNQLDRCSNGYIEYSEFLNLIQPYSQKYSQILKNRKPFYIQNIHEFSKETLKIFVDLIRLTIRKEQNCEEISMKLEKNTYLNYQQAFRQLDVVNLFILENGNIQKITIFQQYNNIQANKGFFNQDDLRFFFKENEFYVNQQDINLLFKKIDRNLNGIINYKDFLQEIEPKLE